MHVMGIGGLDFCDGNLLPSPVGGHPEVNMYDVGKMAADLVTQKPRLYDVKSL